MFPNFTMSCIGARVSGISKASIGRIAGTWDIISRNTRNEAIREEIAEPCETQNSYCLKAWDIT